MINSKNAEFIKALQDSQKHYDAGKVTVFEAHFKSEVAIALYVRDT